MLPAIKTVIPQRALSPGERGVINESLKEQATVQDLKKEIAAMKVSLRRMSNQLKVSRSAQLGENRY